MKYSQAIIVAAIASAAVVSAAPSAVAKPSTKAEAKAAALAVPATQQDATTPAATTAAPHKKHGHHKKGHHAQPKGKESKIHHRIKGSAGHVNPAAAKKAATSAIAKPPTTESAVPAAAPVTRDLFDEEDLFEREFDEEFDELVARGRLSGVVNAVRKGMKGHKMNTAIGAAGIAATVGSTLGVANAQKQQRDFDEELDELVARGRLSGLINKARHGLKGHKTSGAIAAVNGASTAASFLAPQQRDFEDLEDLEAREFEDELDELVARGRLSGVVNAVRKGMKGHKMNTAIGAASIAATVGSSVGVANAQKQQRDFDEELGELIARGRLSGLINKARHGLKGHKTSGAIAAVNGASTAASFLAPQQRDFEDLEDLEARDFEEELEELVARGRLGGLVSKVRNGLKGHKTNAAFAAINAGSTAASFMAPQRRDFDEELEELVARGKLGGLVNKVRQGLKGHKTNAAFAAINAGSTAASFLAPQQRDLGDFDELEMRDFDFEIDELD